MDRPIPGTVKNVNREFLYIECGDDETFIDIFKNKLFAYGDSPQPSFGGVITGHVSLQLPIGIKLYGLSYKGDIAGNRRKILECCDALGLRWGKIEDRSIELSTGEVFALGECDVTFSDGPY